MSYLSNTCIKLNCFMFVYVICDVLIILLHSNRNENIKTIFYVIAIKIRIKILIYVIKIYQILFFSFRQRLNILKCIRYSLKARFYQPESNLYNTHANI